MNSVIYVALLDEGIDVWRPVQAKLIEGNIYQILEHNGSPEGEKWEFPIGSKVLCETRELSDGKILAATRLISE